MLELTLFTQILTIITTYGNLCGLHLENEREREGNQAKFLVAKGFAIAFSNYSVNPEIFGRLRMVNSLKLVW